MGLVMMSERELNRVEVLSQVADGRCSTLDAAALLAVSQRQIQRMMLRYRDGGAGAIRHKARGRRPNNQKSDGVREYVLSLIRESYADFGPTLVAEKLSEKHGITLCQETVRKWMIADGIWLNKSQRRTFHQPRSRRDCYGELIQIDGSDHHWFEDRAERCTLLVFIDDATSKLMELRFVPSESTFSYFAALEGYLTTHGRPVAFYSDKHSVFRIVAKEAKGGQRMTQFGRALSELNIEILCANSSQAKGRVERANRTLQDRLVKELRLAGVTGIEDGNAFLPGFMEGFNAKFAKPPARSDNLHRAMNVEPDRLADVLCWRDTRNVSQQLTIMYERKKYMLEVNDMTRDLVGKDVDTYAFPDGQFQIRWKGVALPYTVFDKNQRVTHAAITENKLLGDQLAWVKKQQELLDAEDGRSKARIKTSSERGGYVKTGKRRPGRPSILQKRRDAKQAEILEMLKASADK
jgi:transposase